MSSNTNTSELKLDELNAGRSDPAPRSGALDQASSEALRTLYDIPVSITAVLGRTHIEVNNLLELSKGDVVELDRKVGEAIDIYVNNRLVARGEVVLIDDRLGITMTEIIKGGQTG
jgi:flagellar motor switch protein FliN/FliY